MKKILIFLMIVGLSFSLYACGDKREEKEAEEKTTEEKQKETEEETEDPELLQEEYEEKCELIMKEIEILTANSDYAGTVHAVIWDSVGVDEVSKYIGYVKKYYDNEEYEVLVCGAFGVSALNGAAKKEALEYAEQYVLALETIEDKIELIDELFEEFEDDYGDEFDIEDIEEYYLESVLYAEYASTIDGSYLTYTQTLDDYQNEIAKLKKRAERSY